MEKEALRTKCHLSSTPEVGLKPHLAPLAGIDTFILVLLFILKWLPEQEG